MARPRSTTPLVASGVRIVRLFGIDLVVHPSWLLSLALLTFYAHGEIVADHVVRDAGVPAAWAVSIGFGLAIAACIVAHELAHSLIARAYRLPVRRITLFALGGVSQIEREAPTPRAEFAVAVAGPLSSVVIATCLGGVARALNPSTEGPIGPWGFFAFINIALALFNLIPAFPMDGGRVLRSALWAGARDRARATRWAAAAGKTFASVLIGGGLVLMALPLLDPDGGWTRWGGIWFALIGTYLYTAAGNAARLEGGSVPNAPRLEPPSDHRNP